MPSKEVVDLLNKGKGYLKRAKFRDARKYFDEAAKMDPRYPEVWFLRGETFAAESEYNNSQKRYPDERDRERDVLAGKQEALINFNKALALDQNYAEALTKISVILYNLNRFEEALAASTRASSLNGNDATAWYIKGVCLDELDRSDEAQEAYGKSLELEIIIDMKAEQQRMKRR